MGHYAYVNENLIVENVIKSDIQHILRCYPNQLNRIPGWWKTSYNTKYGKHWEPSADGTNNAEKIESSTPEKSLRKNFAGVGYSYIPAIDAFVAPKPYEGWILDYDVGDWVCPLKKNIRDFEQEEVHPVEWDEERFTWFSHGINKFWDDTLEEWVD